MTERRRRRVIRSIASVGAAFLAGCGFRSSPGDDGATTRSEPEPTDDGRPNGETARPTSSRPTTGTGTGTEPQVRGTMTMPPPVSPSSTATEPPAGTGSSPPTAATATVPGSLSGLERRVFRVGRSIRPSIAVIRTADGDVGGMAWFVEPDVLATTPDAFPSESPRVERMDGTELSTTVLGRTGPGATDDVAALRTDSEGPTLSPGDPSALSTGQVVATVAYHALFSAWLVAYGRVTEWTGGRERFVTRVPLAYRGAPVVTLDGRVVGTPVAFRVRAPTGAAGPPEPAPPTVQTTMESWVRPVNEPVSDVLDRVDAWTS